MAWDGRIPFDEDGHPMVYADGGWSKCAEWRDNTPFEDTLTFKNFTRGRSAARAVFLSKALGCRVEMFLATLKTVIPNLVEGKLSGTWRFEKRGQNYGIRPA